MTLSSTEVSRALDLFEFAPGKKASWSTLAALLPDVETALFFAKAYRLSYTDLGTLLKQLFKTGVIKALLGGDAEHSTELQDYIVDTVPEDAWPMDQRPDFVADTAHGEILPELWEQANITIAKSIAEVADKLSLVLDSLPSPYGEMAFQHLAKLNRQRPTIGVYQAGIHHSRVSRNLVVFDVSGSMSEGTVRAIAGDVVALSYKANASLAIVSNTTRVWDPGTFSTEDVLREAEYGGTHYETLASLFARDWGTVVSIADYDSSPAAKQWVASSPGRIGQLLDISLVSRPTFLAEVLGQLADEVKPLLISSSYYPLAA